MPLILPGNVGSATAATGYNVANSLRLNVASTASLSVNMGTSSNRRIWTFSIWHKKSTFGGTQNIVGTGGSSDQNHIVYENSQLTVRHYNGSANDIRVGTNRQFEDVSAFYHIVVAVDTTQGTAANRVKIYVNGVQETSFEEATYPDQNYDWDFFQNGADTYISRRGHNDESHLDGYIAEVAWLDGTQAAPTAFGEFDSDSGIWKPKDFKSDVTFGDAGFYLEFKESGTSQNSSGLGADTSGQTNHFAVNNLTAVNQSTDTCTNNFATWNSLQPTNATLTEGNLVGASSASSGHYSGISSIGVSSGKWYFECKQTQESTANEGMIGVIIFDGSNTITALLNPVGRGGGWGMQDGTRGFSTDSGGSGSTTDNFHAGWTDDDIIGIALDIDNSRVYFSKNGQWNNSGSWDASSPTTSQTLQNGLGDGTYFFMAGDASGSNNNTWSANFGSPAHAISSGNTDGNGYGNFEYAVPSGYFSLNTKNLAEYG